MAYWITGSLTPFDDTFRIEPKKTTTTRSLYDTSAFDNLRQGVELKTLAHLYSSTQPKLWAGHITNSGSISHESPATTTFGQSVSYTEFQGTSTFTEQQVFNVVDYIVLSSSYPYPIVFNDGPQQQQECIIEPLTIPFRLPTNEGPYYVHGVGGEILGGNALDGLRAGSSRSEQFISYKQPQQARFFLDQGEQRIGDTLTGSIRIPGYTVQIQRLMNPWEDGNNDYIISQFANLGTDMSGAIRALQFNNNNDIRPFGKKSATAGFSVYGPGAARYGTDSVAYNGWSRGS